MPTAGDVKGMGYMATLLPKAGDFGFDASLRRLRPKHRC